MGIGDRMRDVRHARGMSYEQVGNRVGIGRSTIRKWETGEIQSMSVDNMLKVCEALSVTPGYLLGIEDLYGNQMDSNVAVLTKPVREEQRLIECYRAADAKGKARIMRIAEEEKAREDEFRAEEVRGRKKAEA